MDIYDKSLETLKKIAAGERNYGYKIFLLGGWAVWLYNPYMKSKDVDFIVEKENFWKLRDFLLKCGFRETANVLEKRGFAVSWEGDKIELDVYTEKIGKWDVKELIDDSRKIKGVRVLSPTKLFLLKAHTALERLGTAKGEKDLSDILALLDAEYSNINFFFAKQQVDLQKILSIALSDFQLTSKLYPVSMKRYREVKAHLKGQGIL